MFTNTSRTSIVLLIASLVMFLAAAGMLILSQPLTSVQAQQGNTAPNDMQELCRLFASQDASFSLNITWTNNIVSETNPTANASNFFAPQSILWCGQDFMCFDHPFEGSQGDMCLPYTAIHQIWLENGGIGE